MEVNVHHAKTHLSKLIAAAESGQEVIIARAGKPAVKLVLVAPTPTYARNSMRGAGIEKLWLSPEAFSQEADAAVQELFDVEVERSTKR